MFIRIGIVDDHELICDGIRNMIEYNSNHLVVFQANSGKECFDYLFQNNIQVDVLLLDINMPDYNGFQILQKIRRNNTNTKVIFITADDSIEMLLNAVNAGVNGYILKDATPEELFRAIEIVYCGESFIQHSLLSSLQPKLILKREQENAPDHLTVREKEILGYVATGKINKEIAIELDISEGTVKNHLSSIFKKFGVYDRTQAAVFAIRNEIVNM